MRLTMTSLSVAVAAPIGALALAFSPAGPLPLPHVPTPTELLAQALYMRGTKIGGYTDDDRAFVGFANGVIGQTAGPGAPTLTVDDGDDWRTGDQIEYNGGFWPVSQGGLSDLTYGASVRQGLGRVDDRVADERADDPNGTILVYGYSQSAVILSQYKAQTTDGNVVYVLLANPGRPNGGILSRFTGFTIPVLDIPLSGPTPTGSAGWTEGDAPTTYDITQQYDGWADFPAYPLNVLADANAILGIVYLHGNYETEVDPATDLAPGAPNTDTHTYGDTAYYTVGTDLLPLLRPLEQLGVPRPLLVGLDAPLRVLVEQGYDRTTNPGQPTPAGVIRIANPITDVGNFLRAIPVGIDDGLQAGGFGRPLHTESAGMYGVGGPEVTPPSPQQALDPGDQTRTAAPESDAPEAAPKQLDKPEPPRTRLHLPRMTPPPKKQQEDAAVDAALRTPADDGDTAESETAKPPKKKPATDVRRSVDKTLKRAVDTLTGRHERRESREQRKDTAEAGGTDSGAGGYVGKHRKAE
jgi:hypothetical protein